MIFEYQRSFEGLSLAANCRNGTHKIEHGIPCSTFVPANDSSQIVYTLKPQGGVPYEKVKSKKCLGSYLSFLLSHFCTPSYAGLRRLTPSCKTAYKNELREKIDSYQVIFTLPHVAFVCK